MRDTYNVCNIKYCVHYCNCRSAAKCTSKDSPSILVEESQYDDVILRSQPTQVVDEAPKHRVKEAAEINVVSCSAYGIYATSINNIDHEDYEEMANLTSEFRQSKIDYDDEDYV